MKLSWNAGSRPNRLLLGLLGTREGRCWQMSTAAVRSAASSDHGPTLDETTAVSAEDLHLHRARSVVPRDCPPTPDMGARPAPVYTAEAVCGGRPLRL